MSTRYLSVKEVAKLLNVHPKTVYKKKLDIPGYFNLAGLHFFDEEVLVARLKDMATNKPVNPNKTNRKRLPDDPCYCGSGKKYKLCHGKDRHGLDG